MPIITSATSAMDHSFSVDEVPSDSLSTLQPPQPQVTNYGECDGRVVSCEAAAAGGDATDQIPSDEWSFERLLEEGLTMDYTATPMDSIGSPVLHVDPSVPDVVEPATVAMGGVAGGDPVEYNAMLKRKLEADLAAISMWRGSAAVHPEISQGSFAHIGGTRNLEQNKFTGGGRSRAQNAKTCAKRPASSSSMERSPSDDDDMDGEVAIVGFTMPDPEKMKKRKQSNRESARRSRTRKAAHMKDLENKVTLLEVENALLLTRLNELIQKYNAAAIDNRVLSADMETLRTKVKMAEDNVNRLLASSLLPSTVVPGVPSFNNLPFVGSASHVAPAHPSSVPIPDNNITNFYTTATIDAVVNNSYMPVTEPSPLQAEGVVVNGSSDQIAASDCAMAIELLEKRMMSDDMPTFDGGEAAPSGADQVAHF